MKSNWIVVLCLLACLMLPSCGPHMYKTMSSGTDDVAYVIVIKENTDRTSYDDVQLVIDGSTCFYGSSGVTSGISIFSPSRKCRSFCRSVI